MTDQQLQLALAKMLPEKISFMEVNEIGRAHGIKSFHYWSDSNTELLDTEWLHVCWLVEQMLDVDERNTFVRELQIVIAPLERECNWCWFCFSASWQQRAEALCKVKGITP